MAAYLMDRCRLHPVLLRAYLRRRAAGEHQSAPFGSKTRADSYRDSGQRGNEAALLATGEQR
ncbi:hypothetical protein [Salinispora cortesiana]|uniref:hypothetical protein n=1 Tax=Salinispora cortesiana TaxID=1305843 RepID=UPI0004128825|nr:hypothetical protein [Salinispora cortesiana]